MDEDGYEPTLQLRFLERQLVAGKGPYGRFLQQLWQLTYDGVVVGEEWRDVPLFVHEGRPEDKNESAG